MGYWGGGGEGATLVSEGNRPGVPDDEPVIGGPAPRPRSREERDAPRIGERARGAPPPARRAVDPWQSRNLRRDRLDIRSYGRDGPRAGYQGATRRSAGRTAAVSLITVASLALGAVLIVLLFRLLDGNGETQPLNTTPTVDLSARITSPSPGLRVTVDEELAVSARVTSDENVVRFELLVSSISEDTVTGGRQIDETTYAAELTARFQAAGAYDLVVRAHTASGQQVESAPVQVIVVQPATPTPTPPVTAAIATDAVMRTGPGEAWPQVGELQGQTVVTLIGRTDDQQWLQIQTGGGLWVRRSAVDVDPRVVAGLSVATAPPPPTATPTPTPSETGDADGEPAETPSPTATVGANAPDFIPTNAVLLDGGATLRVTIANSSTNPFSGAVVLRVEEAPASPGEQVVNVSMEPNGEAAVNFILDPPLTRQSTVRVIVDPDEAIDESNEDNNSVDFIVVPPPEGPELSLTATIAGDVLTVTIENAGGALETSDARLVMSVPGETTTRTISPLAIAEGESATITGIAVSRAGEAIRVTLFIDGVNVAAIDVLNPNVADATPDPDDGPPEPDLGDGDAEPEE